MRTVRDIIEGLGGISAVAKAHTPVVATSTVSGWIDVNFVPEWRREGLRAAAKKLKKPFNINDLPPKDQRFKAVG